MCWTLVLRCRWQLRLMVTMPSLLPIWGPSAVLSGAELKHTIIAQWGYNCNLIFVSATVSGAAYMVDRPG